MYLLIFIFNKALIQFPNFYPMEIFVFYNRRDDDNIKINKSIIQISLNTLPVQCNMQGRKELCSNDVE